MAKSIKRPDVTLLFMPDVEKELAPILASDYTVQVFLDLSPREQKINVHGLFFYKTAKVERHDTIMGCIRYYPYPHDGRKRYQMEVFGSPAPLWEEDADTVEEAMKAMNAALKRLVSEERATRRAAQAERLAAYDRQRAEAAA